MKVAYLTLTRPGDRRAWSGINYQMRRSLEMAGMQIEPIGPLRSPIKYLPERVARRMAERLFNCRRLLWKYDARAARSHAKDIERRLRGSGADAIFSPSSMILSSLDLSIPTYFWTDATFALMLDYYYPRLALASNTLRDGEQLEYAAISKAKHAFYASDWAAQSAERDYHAPLEKLSVMPFGANLEREPSEADIESWIEARPASPCRLCLVGVDWYRKGADLALAVIDSVTKKGLRCEFSIVGCRPPRGFVLPPYARSLGFIDSTTAKGRAEIGKIFSESHFLIVPSRAEAYGLVFAEASAHGVPSLASQTGGITFVVRDGVNGYTAPLGDQLVPQLAAKILELMGDKDRYRALARSSYREFVTRLNWKTSGRKIRGIMENRSGVQGRLASAG